jgi:hypothetical protein
MKAQICLYVHMLVFPYACMLVCPYACIPVCLYVRIPVCLYSRMLVCSYSRMPVCSYVHMLVFPYACMLVCPYACIPVCLYVRMLQKNLLSSSTAETFLPYDFIPFLRESQKHLEAYFQTVNKTNRVFRIILRGEGSECHFQKKRSLSKKFLNIRGMLLKNESSFKKP